MYCKRTRVDRDIKVRGFGDAALPKTGFSFHRSNIVENGSLKHRLNSFGKAGICGKSE